MPGYSYTSSEKESPSSSTPSQTAASSGGSAGNAARLEALGLSGSGASEARPTLRMGTKGASVADAQSLLNGHGASLDEDGQFGPLTDGAVRDFQSDAALVADGVVGPLTWGALDADLPEEETPTPTEEAPAAHAQEAPAAETAPAPTEEAPEQDPTAMQEGIEAAATLMDEIDFTGRCLGASSADLTPYLASRRLSNGLAYALGGLGTLNGEGRATYDLALSGLADGSLLGIVYRSDVSGALSSLPATDPDRARLKQQAATVKGGLFLYRSDHSGGILVVQDGWQDSRSLGILIGHELSHYRSRNPSDPVLEDASHDLPAAGVGKDPAAVAATRQSFVDEIAARHTEWRVAWDMRLSREGQGPDALSLPAPAQLLSACVDFVQLEAVYERSYDPVGYWSDLVKAGPEYAEAQVKAWLPFVEARTLAADPDQDRASKDLFRAATVVNPLNPSRGLENLM